MPLCWLQQPATRLATAMREVRHGSWLLWDTLQALQTQFIGPRCGTAEAARVMHAYACIIVAPSTMMSGIYELDQIASVADVSQ